MSSSRGPHRGPLGTTHLGPTPVAAHVAASSAPPFCDFVPCFFLLFGCPFGCSFRQAHPADTPFPNGAHEEASSTVRARRALQEGTHRGCPVATSAHESGVPLFDETQAQVRLPQRIRSDAHRFTPSRSINSTLRTLRHWNADGSRAACRRSPSPRAMRIEARAFGGRSTSSLSFTASSIQPRSTLRLALTLDEKASLT